MDFYNYFQGLVHPLDGIIREKKIQSDLERVTLIRNWMCMALVEPPNNMANMKLSWLVLLYHRLLNEQKKKNYKSQDCFEQIFIFYESVMPYNSALFLKAMFRILQAKNSIPTSQKIVIPTMELSNITIYYKKLWNLKISRPT